MEEELELISYLDTNVVIWLHAGELDALSPKARHVIDESSSLLISAMVLLELEMLQERKIIRLDAGRIYLDLNQAFGLNLCQLLMAQVIQSATTIKWTREPGDRTITANAIANNRAPLVTRDRNIRTHYENAVW